MALDITELRLTGIDEKNLTTIRAYEDYLQRVLPPSEVINDMFIDVNFEVLLSDLYFFTSGLMIEIPDFVTYYQGKFHPKKMDFTIHPIKKCILFVTMRKSDAAGSDPRTVEVTFALKTGATFSFSEMKENAKKLESIIQTYLLPNIGTG